MALKVFDLSCEHDHLFEGWFASLESYEDQASRGLVRCPICQSAPVTRRVSAPHLNVSHLNADREPRPKAPAKQPTGRAEAMASSCGQQAQPTALTLRLLYQHV